MNKKDTNEREAMYKQTTTVNVSKMQKGRRKDERRTRFNERRDISTVTVSSPPQETDARKLRLNKWIAERENTKKAAQKKPFVIPAHTVQKPKSSASRITEPKQLDKIIKPKPLVATKSLLSTVRMTRSSELRLKSLTVKKTDKIIKKPVKRNTIKPAIKNTGNKKDIVRGKNEEKSPPVQLNFDPLPEIPSPTKKIDRSPEHTHLREKSHSPRISIGGGGPKLSDLIKLSSTTTGNNSNFSESFDSFFDIPMPFKKIETSLGQSPYRFQRRSVRILKKSMEEYSTISPPPLMFPSVPENDITTPEKNETSRKYKNDIIRSGIMGSVTVVTSTPIPKKSILRNSRVDRSTKNKEKSVNFSNCVGHLS